MEPTLWAGEFVIVNRFGKLKVGDLVVAYDIDRDIKVIKRVKSIDRNMILIVSENIGHGKPIKINRSEIIGKVILF